MKKIIPCALAALMSASCLAVTACGGEAITIYTSTEDYNMDYLQSCLDEAFPDYNVKIEYMSTSNIAAKVIAEGETTDCDIIYAQEYGYISQMAEAGVLFDLSSFDKSCYMDDTLQIEEKDYLIPAIRTGGAVIINNYVLEQNDLPKPTSYADLLDEKYEGLISMPSPKSSGTGYMFYLSLVNAMGETDALSYFDSFTENVLAYTSSGSGPVNALVSRKAAIGLGMISQAAEKITGGVDELEILIFEEGAPFNLYGSCVVKGKEEKAGVMEIMEYLHSTYTNLSSEAFYPESVLKDKTYDVANFPESIVYADMSGNTLERKEDLLAKWTH